MAPERTRRGLRLAFAGTGIREIDGAIWVSVDGALALAGRPPSGRPLAQLSQLIVTSKYIDLRGDRLFTRCSRCGKVRPLVEMGLRQMPTGEWRNQPQCPRCRSNRAANDNQAGAA